LTGVDILDQDHQADGYKARDEKRKRPYHHKKEKEQEQK
jgi:hypothetical protein